MLAFLLTKLMRIDWNNQLYFLSFRSSEPNCSSHGIVQTHTKNPTFNKDVIARTLKSTRVCHVLIIVCLYGFTLIYFFVDMPKYRTGSRPQVDGKYRFRWVDRQEWQGRRFGMGTSDPSCSMCLYTHIHTYIHTYKYNPTTYHCIAYLAITKRKG